jgi:hypothetical protein
MDPNVIAFSLVQRVAEETHPTKVGQRVASPRVGIESGAARAASWTGEQRIGIASKASAARWEKKSAA